LIFFVYPGPKGSEENQFTPLGDGVNKLIFKRFVVINMRINPAKILETLFRDTKLIIYNFAKYEK